VKKAKKARIKPYRRTVQILSLLLLVAIPFLNLHGWNGLTGWYQSLGVFKLWIASPLESLESILTSRHFYTVLLVAMLPPVVLALVLGRVFCSWMCPMGLLSEWADEIKRRLLTRRRARSFESKHRLPRRTLWFVLVGEILLSLMVGTSLFSIYSPPGIIGRELARAIFLGTLGGELLFILAILVFEFLLVRRGFCRYLCPLGALLGWIGQKRSLKVQLDAAKCARGCRLCEQGKMCSWGLLPRCGEGESIYCTNCGDCVDLCPFDALHFVWQMGKPVPAGRRVELWAEESEAS